MEHIFIQGKNRELMPLVLLHGTGGDEQSLLQLAEIIAPDASVLSFRGDVSENGANRFFARYADGSFDLASLKEKTGSLIAEVKELAPKYEFDAARVVAVGYSNGANIAANAILTNDASFQKAILFHAMPSGEEMPDFALNQTAVFVTAGVNDPLVNAAGSQALIDGLQARGADVGALWTENGHNLTLAEVEAARDWYVAQHD
ncbi:alpha/beta hydrolase [Paenilisteria rocourtiae]|uniref:Phospholipase/carboxylesterase n=1 Tax=Listeria rocourtiae TaxID=647910 RepID=A0A4R6ZSU0_9LIST|nr:alpha/beta hydrolase [Listeria rocourtiae]EUJ48105.1 carboxylesterase [Listeria rocourtiae FSL F6-920]TDR55522.1 phospholipase/carboxylesterase [Listeria rocourtiae]